MSNGDVRMMLHRLARSIARRTMGGHPSHIAVVQAHVRWPRIHHTWQIDAALSHRQCRRTSEPMRGQHC